MPPLPETLLSNLCVFNIRTAPDLIVVPPAELLRKLPVVSITFLELTNRIAHVRNPFVGPAFTADQSSEEYAASVSPQRAARAR